MKFHVFLKDFNQAHIVGNPRYKLKFLDEVVNTEEQAYEKARSLIEKELKLITKKASKSEVFRGLLERIKGKGQIFLRYDLIRQPLEIN